MSGTPIRPPGINLQTVQGRPPGQILVRNESGQYHLVRMAMPSSNIYTSSMQVGNSPVQLSTVGAGQGSGLQPPRPVYIRTALVQPVKLGQNQQYVIQNTQAPTGQNQQTIMQNVQAPILVTTNQQVLGFNQQPLVVVSSAQMTPSSSIPNSTGGTQQGQVNTPQTKLDAQQAYERSKQKCRDFLANLLELSQKEYKPTETKVRMLVQALINSQIEPEAFCITLEQILQATPQPSLIGFLKKSLPPLRQALIAKELKIEGIQAPFGDSNLRIMTSQAQPMQLQPMQQIQPTQMHSLQSAIQKNPNPQIHLSLRQVRPPSPQLSYTSNPQMQPAPLQKSLPVPVHQSQTLPGQQMPLEPFHVQYVRPQQVESSAPIAGPSNEKHKKTNASSSSAVPAALNVDKTSNDDDLNDVAAMGGIDLVEECKKVLISTENIGTEIKSCKDEFFMELSPLHARICRAAARHGLMDPQQDVTRLMSHAVQQYLKNYVEKLACIAEHRNFKEYQSTHVVTQNVKGQLKFLEDIDKVESQKQKELEREVLLKAVKSKSKVDNLEQKSLKEKGKELQRMEMEEIRLKDANLTALQAIGIKRKLKSEHASPSGTSSSNRPPPKPVRIKRVNYRDMLFLLENEKETCRSTFLYKCYLRNTSK